jgi:hypothetical protein
LSTAGVVTARSGAPRTISGANARPARPLGKSKAKCAASARGSAGQCTISVPCGSRLVLWGMDATPFRCPEPVDFHTELTRIFRQGTHIGGPQSLGVTAKCQCSSGCGNEPQCGSCAPNLTSGGRAGAPRRGSSMRRRHCAAASALMSVLRPTRITAGASPLFDKL